ncbi:MAG: ACP S-malonyltransferase [Acholeplasmataceae bacterium]|nr:ACP S-malonyltransferase [Acholeplasmataceae bacterium]
MSKLAVLFSGQGSQFSGMGLDFILQNDKLKQKLNRASEILGFDVFEILNGSDDRMNETIYTQPLVFLASVMAFESAQEIGLNADAYAGFSLGEYTAFYAADIFNFDQVLDMIKIRAHAMSKCAEENPGKMAAIIGLTHKEVEAICQTISNEKTQVVPANYNAFNQLVISGHEQAVIQAMELAKERHAKRTILLNVSGAFHSSLMKSAGQVFESYLSSVKKNISNKPIYLNTTAKKLVDEDLKTEMVKQLQSPVRFEQTIKAMINDGLTHFVEIGPGTVLSGLVRKANLDVHVTNVQKKEDLITLKGWLMEHGFKK